ncbi:acyltransferase family protein [Roseateles sp. BYS78W]|uniref:Acyltransferase family protein n=1 Tax=Pelomonas candidula TaxID=3299025 RepID=A0ABW7HC58_9BURK
MNKNRDAHYVPAIDGLRAIAVLSVLFFHLGGWLPGGFVGVDVFFVISGYVVASAAAGLPATSFREFLLAFYARRLIRIAPALVGCLLVTMAVMACIVPVLPDGRLTEINTKTGLAAFWGISNVVLAAGSNDYWSAGSELNPFTHTWSLAIEEQFYLVFPFVYFMWLAGRRRLAKLFLVTAVAASLGAAIIYASQPVFSFYLLPARFWELGVGVGLFFFREQLLGVFRLAPAWFADLVAVCAMAALCCALIFTDSGRFPWPGALMPVVAVAALILVILARPEGLIPRMLSLRPMTATGKLSYSLYLWHWPVIVFGRWTSGMERPSESLIALALSFVLAYLSFRFVESPVRQLKGLSGYRRSALVATALSGVGICFAGAVGVAIARPVISISVTSDPLYWRWDGSWPSDTTHCTAARAEAGFGAGRLLIFKPQGCTTTTKSLFVAGDSHGRAYVAMLDLYARETGATVYLYGIPGCGFFNLRRRIEAEPAECQQFVKSVLSEIRGKAKPGDVLFLPGLRVARYPDITRGKAAVSKFVDDADDAVVTREAAYFLKPVVDSGVRVVVEAPKPALKSPPYRCFDWFNQSNPVCHPGLIVSRAEAEARRSVGMRRLGQLAAAVPGLEIWDPLPAFCAGDVCGSVDSHRPLLFDGDHISGYANKLLAADFNARFGAGLGSQNSSAGGGSESKY